MKLNMNTICALALAGIFLFSPFARADNTDYTDVWWNPQQSGWGMNLARQDGRIYATLHAYDANGAPLWYVAYLDQQYDSSFSGNVYSFTSTPTNAPLSPGQATADTRGTLKFIPLSPMEGVIRYSIDGQQGEQPVKRFSLLSPSFPALNLETGMGDGSDRHRSYFSTQSDCRSPVVADGGAATIKVTPSDDPAAPFIQIDFPASSSKLTPDRPGNPSELIVQNYNCTIVGHLMSEGRLGGSSDAKYSCYSTNGQQAAWEQLPVSLTRVRMTPSRVEGYWEAQVPNLSVTTGAQVGLCTQKGRFTFLTTL